MMSRYRKPPYAKCMRRHRRQVCRVITEAARDPWSWLLPIRCESQAQARALARWWQAYGRWTFTESAEGKGDVVLEREPKP